MKTVLSVGVMVLLSLLAGLWMWAFWRAHEVARREAKSLPPSFIALMTSLIVAVLGSLLLVVGGGQYEGLRLAGMTLLIVGTTIALPSFILYIAKGDHTKIKNILAGGDS